MQRANHLFGRALRETGQALDRLGLTFSNNEIYKETFSRHRAVMNLFDKVRRNPQPYPMFSTNYANLVHNF